MPRRGAYQGPPHRNWNNGQHDNRHPSNGGNKFYNDLDDARDRQHSDGRKDNRRRVSFKPAGSGPSRMNRNWSADVRARLGDDDVMSELVMDSNNERGGGEGSDGGRRGGRKGHRGFQRRGSPIPKGALGANGKRKLIAGSGWFQVTIPHGHKYDKTAILKQLMTAVHPHILIPHYFKTELTSISFFVDDLAVAEILLNADRSLHMPDGTKMLLRVRTCLPNIQIDATLREKMKLAMVKRYTAATKALDLTKFHADPDLQDIFCPLFRQPIMLAAIDVIAEHIPDLEALKLDDNKIQSIEHFKCLPVKLPFLKILHLANNKIANTASLSALSECQLIDLVLVGNPVQTHKARDERMLSRYVSEIRSIFRKLIRLDGKDLPPQIGFDVAEDSNLPSPKASFLCNMAGADIVRQFLEQYFILFDSGNRQPLLDAYHEQAMLSVTATNSQQPHLRLDSYTPHSRNILRLKSIDERSKQLHFGRLPVVAFLSQLPDTQHDPMSFGVDLTLFSPKLIMLTVSGVFKEKSKSSNTNLRSFQKAMTIVPSGSGFCIKNELLHFSHVTMAQVKTAFKPPAAAPAVALQIPSALPSSAVPDDATKQNMIQMMSQHSNMNIEWSRKCLEETNWDFNRAGFTFTELHKQNKIPPEAFVK